MRLTAVQRRDVYEILDRIEQGLAAPQLSGRIGRYIRQYARGRAELERVLEARGLERREDGAISGRAIGAVSACAMVDLDTRFRGRRLGEVAHTTAVCEELGCVANLVLWLKGESASRARDVLVRYRALRLEGDFRWTPPSRITPGEARAEPGADVPNWQGARMLKAVSDDLARPPHALEYVRDHGLGDPGMKFFRCVCTWYRKGTWQVLPALGHAVELRVADMHPKKRDSGRDNRLEMLLIYREPWSDAWTVVERAEISPDMALAHSITWADLQWEMRELPFAPEVVSSLRHSLNLMGVRPQGIGEPNLVRRLLPPARDVLRQLRGINTVGH